MKILLLLTLFPFFSNATITPPLLLKSVNEIGVHKAILEISKEDWKNSVINGISSGDSSWLSLVPLLAVGAGPKYAAMLEDSLSNALTTNTKETLHILNIIDRNQYPYMVGSDIVCTLPFDKSKNAIYNYYQRTRAALKKITPEGDKCLSILDLTMDEFKNNKTKTNQEYP
ncbi:hypothetical protein B5C26_21380 [Photorhabdus luminescens]|uniref:hypothetical protein n=1 Tax=Photorhabdus luminescens TaxID=29488 RepID=UPI000B4D1D6E|nr:hypothetical protein [Photorhabdus luminescens]OWO79330.1 hypothetical protein B5C26_21380 [Photorhabdus luminescens]